MKEQKKDIPKKVSSGDGELDALVSKAFKKGKYKRPTQAEIIEAKRFAYFGPLETEIPPFIDILGMLKSATKKKQS